MKTKSWLSNITFILSESAQIKCYEYLKKRGINTQVHYIPIHKLPFYERLYGKQTFTNSEQYYSKCLSLPLYPSLEDKEQDFIIKEIKNFLSWKK